MDDNQRKAFLKIGACAVVGLWVLDSFVFSPAIAHWKSQSEEIASLRGKVQRGRQLIERETSIRDHWKQMLRTQLPEDRSVAESEVYKGMSRWTRESRINFNFLDPNWLAHPEGYDTFFITAAAQGDQASIGRLIYEIEVDPLPARIESCEISARDAKGQQLTVSLKFSFIHFTDVAKNSR